ncbi:hypothetical protein VTI28DRAFT_7770 [Corynascus sepedonium]
MSSDHTIRARLAIPFFALLSLTVAALSSANARFAAVLRDRARSNYASTSDGIMGNKFQSLQRSVLMIAVITAIASTAFAIFGIMMVVHPSWLRGRGSTLGVYAALHTVLALIMIVPTIAILYYNMIC